MTPFDVDRRDKSDRDRYSSPTTSTGQQAAPPWYGHPEERERMEEEPRGRVYLSPRRYAAPMHMRQEQYDSADRSGSARPHYYDDVARRSSSSTPSPLRTFTGKRRASGEMANYFSDEFEDSPYRSRTNRNEAESAEKVIYHEKSFDVGSWNRREADRGYERRSDAKLMGREQDFDRYYQSIQEQERPSGSRYNISSAMDNAPGYRSDAVPNRTASTRQRISGLRISPASTIRFPGYDSYAHSTDLDDDQPFRAIGTGWEAMRSAPEAVTGVPAVAIGTSAASPSSSFVSSHTAATSAPGTTMLSVRPITNASRNIKFGMLQPHFERPLQEAALKFGVCTTLLKKICRKNGIANWPYRRICGLRKSIASMEKQVQYFDGDQKKSYADQLRKLQIELEAYKRIGTAPTPEFIALMEREDAAMPEEAHGDISAVDNDMGDQSAEVDETEPRSSGQPVAPMQASPVSCTERGSSQGKASTNSNIQGSDVQEFRHGDVTKVGDAWPQPQSSLPRSDEHKEPHRGRDHLREATGAGDSGRYGHRYHPQEYDRRHEDEIQLDQYQYQHQHIYQPNQHHHQHHHHQHFHAQQTPQYHQFQSHHHHSYLHRTEPSLLGLSTIGAHQRALPSIGHMLHRQTRITPEEREEKTQGQSESNEEHQYQF